MRCDDKKGVIHKLVNNPFINLHLVREKKTRCSYILRFELCTFLNSFFKHFLQSCNLNIIIYLLNSRFNITGGFHIFRNMNLAFLFCLCVCVCRKKFLCSHPETPCDNLWFSLFFTPRPKKMKYSINDFCA